MSDGWIVIQDADAPSNPDDRTGPSTVSIPDPDGDQEHKRQTAGFVQARVARQTELAEDYVELIDDLIDEVGEARVVDLAHRLGVSHATVIKTVKRLAASGLVISRPYRSLFLTEEGQALAARSRARHAVVRDFLVSIGVSPETANIDAEGVEHYVSEETLNAMKVFLDRHQKNIEA